MAKLKAWLLSVKTWVLSNNALLYLLAGLTAISLAIAVYFIKRNLITRQAELAKLRTDAEQAKIKAAAQLYQANIADNDAKKEQLKTQAFLANARATRDLEQARAADEANKKALTKIDGITTWAELDAINSARRT